ncbi:MAG: DEAD/DEAH box helicase [Nevskiaceae bacterium]|nr:MAG: DEAD/DEAH box helicase [Nevskiaceae bacterium]
MSADTSDTAPAIAFRDLALSEPVLRALDAVGYESPSPIQAATIPHLLAGRDVLGQAQTGTGKTAAFALPILSHINLGQTAPQALVLAPTRELAIQVAEAFQKYASQLKNFHVLPIYGGQSYEPQLKALKRGVHVVVGTPGRVLDHMKRGTLRLDALRCLVLDEADEMLRMGFIDDVEEVLRQTPPQRQVALFSATMPTAIRRIAQTYLREPAEVTIKSKTTTAANIRQRYLMASGMEYKLNALTRILEAEPFDGMIIFARTKSATTELAEKLEARGYACAALNGDIVQAQRERTVNRLKSGQLDIVVATDVAARGLDVERISHVVNFDIPTDTESYVHRIGRTGRAGRSGEAILFIASRERHLLQTIERATRQRITPMELPSAAAVNDLRLVRFKQKIGETLAAGGLEPLRAAVEQFEQQQGVPLIDIAAALARMALGDKPLLPTEGASERRAAVAAGPERRNMFDTRTPADDAPPRQTPPVRATRTAVEAPVTATPTSAERPAAPARKPREQQPEAGMETFRVEVGHVHNVKPGNIVGAIANEAGLDSQYIGRIEIFDDHSLIDLPEGMPRRIFRDLQKVWVCGQQLRISRPGDGAAAPAPRPHKKKPAGKPPRG